MHEASERFMSPQGFIRYGSTNLHARSGALRSILMHKLQILLCKGRRSIKALESCFGARSSRVRSRKALKSGCTNEAGCAVLGSATRSCLQLSGRCSPSPLLYPLLWKTGAGITFLLRKAALGLGEQQETQAFFSPGKGKAPHPHPGDPSQAWEEL